MMIPRSYRFDYLLGRTDDPAPTNRMNTEERARDFNENQANTPDEIKLLEDYRNLSNQGKEYVRQSAYTALHTYKKHHDASGLETAKVG